jgi:hypothetical protein
MPSKKPAALTSPEDRASTLAAGEPWNAVACPDKSWRAACLQEQIVQITVTAQNPDDDNACLSWPIEHQIIAHWKAAKARSKLLTRAPEEGVTGHQFTNGINLIEKLVCGIGAVACDIKSDVDEIALGLGTSLDFSQRV